MRISDWSSDVCSSDLLHISGINLLVPWDADRPVQASCAQPLAERSREAVSGIREHTAKAHPGGNDPVDFLDSDRRLGAIRAEGLGHARLDHARLVARPAFRQEQPQAQRSEEHTSELQSLMRTSYAVFCLKKKNN